MVPKVPKPPKTVGSKPVQLMESNDFMDALDVAPEPRKPKPTKRKVPSPSQHADPPKASKQSKGTPGQPVRIFSDMIPVKSSPVKSSNADSEGNNQNDDPVVIFGQENRLQSDPVSSLYSELGPDRTDSPVTVPNIIHDTPPDPNLKSILSFGIHKKSKRKIRWRDSDQNVSISEVEYFEMDETERINVSRPAAMASQGHKVNYREMDLMGERALRAQVECEGQSHPAPSVSHFVSGDKYRPWNIRLAPLDMYPPPKPTGQQSTERNIQLQAQSRNLGCLIPLDTPYEPDPEINANVDIVRLAQPPLLTTPVPILNIEYDGVSVFYSYPPPRDVECLAAFETIYSFPQVSPTVDHNSGFLGYHAAPSQSLNTPAPSFTPDPHILQTSGRAGTAFSSTYVADGSLSGDGQEGSPPYNNYRNGPPNCKDDRSYRYDKDRDRNRNERDRDYRHREDRARHGNSRNAAMSRDFDHRRNITCKDWLKGTCSYGDKCKFSHQERAMGSIR